MIGKLPRSALTSTWLRSIPVPASSCLSFSSKKHRSSPRRNFDGATRELLNERKTHSTSVVRRREIKIRLTIAVPNPSGVELSELTGEAVGKSRAGLKFFYVDS